VSWILYDCLLPSFHGLGAHAYVWVQLQVHMHVCIWVLLHACTCRWWQDFPRKDPQSPAMSPFEADLTDYLLQMKLPTAVSKSAA
jgi:hypothetical protein